MAARSTRARSAHATRSTSSSTAVPVQGTEVLGLWTDLPRRQLALVTHSATALVRGTQELRRIQIESSQRAFQEALRFWQELAGATLKLQADFVSSAGEAVVEGASEPTFETFQRAFENTLNGAAAAVGAH